jgi:hypothetical protein
MKLIFGIAEPHQIEGKVYRCGDWIVVADHEAPRWESLGFHREPLPFDDLPSEKGAAPVNRHKAERKPRRRRNG